MASTLGAAARAGRGVVGRFTLREMPMAVRVLFGVLFSWLVLVAIHDATPWLEVLNPVYETLYNGILVGSAVLCLARGALDRDERVAWMVVGVSLALWASGNIYWQLALSDVAEAPYPSLADGFWLGFLPVCYVGVLLLARKRLPHLDSRLWLDGIIAALTTGAISAAVIFGAVHASTGGDTAAVATNLAYPLGDMILLGIVIGAMAAGRGRLDRSWVYFGAGIAVFAVTDSVYLLQVAKGTYVVGTLLDVGWVLGTLLVGVAAWQPAVHKRATGDELPSIIVPIGLGLASLVLLMYDHFEQTNLLALGLAGAALVAVLIRLSLTHRQSRTNLVRTRVQARTDSLTGLGNRFALDRALAQAFSEPAPHLLLLFDLDGFKNYNDSYGHPAGDALLARLGARLADATGAQGARLPRRGRRVLRTRAVAERPPARGATRTGPRGAVRARRRLQDRRVRGLRRAPRRRAGRRGGTACRRPPPVRREEQRPRVGPASERGRAAQRADRVRP